jgi:hypothetical protein
MKPGKPRPPKPFRALKEAKRLARMRLGSPPPARREESAKRSRPKHKKREFEREAGLL